MLITLEKVTHVYATDPPVEALKEIDMEIAGNDFIGLIGPTGSGKSTLVQLLNGLITPTRGRVLIDERDINENKKVLREVRQQVGLVFQYPEHQLFEETIFDEIAFGPRNMKISEEEVQKRVRQVLSLVDMDIEEFGERSPFNLSGGQKRKIAIAGILAMAPRLLILDEPFAGLDPEGRQQLVVLLKKLHQEQQMTLILISHRMEEIALLANRIVVLDGGELVLEGSPREVFSQPERLRRLSLNIPQITEVLFALREKGLEVRTDLFDINKAADEIMDSLRSKNIC